MAEVVTEGTEIIEIGDWRLKHRKMGMYKAPLPKLANEEEKGLGCVR